MQQQQGSQALAHYLTARQDRMRGLLPTSVSPSRFIKSALVQAAITPEIARCDPQTVYRSLMQCAQVGLEIGGGSLAEAYLVPYKGQCTLQVGYRGLLRLVRQSGLIVDVDAEVVCENDEIDLRRGTEPMLSHVPTFDDRGKPIGVYAVVWFSNGHVRFTQLGVSEVERARNGSNSPAWKQWWGEMAKKTALKRLCKTLPMAREAERALAIDDASEGGNGSLPDPYVDDEHEIIASDVQVIPTAEQALETARVGSRRHPPEHVQGRADGAAARNAAAMETLEAELCT